MKDLYYRLDSILDITFNGLKILTYIDIYPDTEIAKRYNDQVDGLSRRYGYPEATKRSRCGMPGEVIVNRVLKLNWSTDPYKDFYVPELDIYAEVKSYDFCSKKKLENLLKKLKIAKDYYDPELYIIFDAQMNFQYTLNCYGSYDYVVKCIKECLNAL